MIAVNDLCGTWVVIEATDEVRCYGDTAVVHVWLCRCIDCGGFRRLSDRALRDPPRCRHALIDHSTPWEEDDRAWYVVACHPNGITLEQVAELLGVTKQAAALIERAALAKLRPACEREGLSIEDVVGRAPSEKAARDGGKR